MTVNNKMLDIIVQYFDMCKKISRIKMSMFSIILYEFTYDKNLTRLQEQTKYDLNFLNYLCSRKRS